LQVLTELIRERSLDASPRLGRSTQWLPDRRIGIAPFGSLPVAWASNMIAIRQHDVTAASSSATHFQQQWRNYRKVVDNNYIFHREVYERLRAILSAEAPRPFRFLDVACGDAAMSVTMLGGLPVAHYHGIDLSRPALDLASAALEGLPCPATLEERDFVEALGAWTTPVDVVWIGQSLHHLLEPGKLALMREIRRVVGERGLLLVWEPTMREDEDRESWLERFELKNRPRWTALSPQEWDAVVAHNRAEDFPEMASRWLSLGREAGFAEADEVLVAPTDLARMYRFRA
jgi:SAM-dependent methyltransferase